MSDIKSFEDLNCWIKGRELRITISEILKTFPNSEKFDLVSQMRRASRSITHNIAEGYGRFHFQENAQFCRIARGSLFELIDQIITAQDEGYINKETHDLVKKQITDCVKILNGYINYLVNKKTK